MSYLRLSHGVAAQPDGGSVNARPGPCPDAGTRFPTFLPNSCAESGTVRFRVVINPDADRAVYKQLADILRSQIASGLYDPDRPLPSADGLARQHHVGKAVAEDALTLLRAEGWITTRRGQRSRVRVEPDRLTIYVRPGTVLRPGRRPTTAESRQWNLVLGERMTDVITDDSVDSYPSDRYEFVFYVPDEDLPPAD